MEKNIHENPRFAISETPKIFLPILKDIFKREGIQEDKGIGLHAVRKRGVR